MADTDLTDTNDLVYRPPPGFVPPTQQENTEAWAKTEREAEQHPERYREQKLAEYVQSPNVPAQPPPEQPRAYPNIPDVGKLLEPKPQPAPPTPPGPQPTKPVQRFVPNSPRSFNRWGKDHGPYTLAKQYPDYMAAGRDMPEINESINIIRGASSQLARFSAPQISQQAGILASIASLIGPFFDFYSNNAFSTAYRNRMLGGLQQQEAQFRMQQEQMQINRERLIDTGENMIANHKAMLADYGEVYDQLAHGDLTQKEAEEAILQLNSKYNHHTLDALLKSKGLGAVQRALEWEDTKMLDIWGGVLSMQQANKKAGKTVGAGTSIDNLIRTGTATPPAGTGGAGSVGTVGPEYTTPEQQAEREQPELPDDPDKVNREDTDKEIAKESDMPTAAGMGLVHQIVADGQVKGVTKGQMKNLAPQYGGNMEIAADKLQQRITDVLNHPNWTDEQKLQAAKAIDPTIGDRVDSLAHYQSKNTSIPAAARQQYEQWAKELNPNWREGGYDAVQKFYTDKTELRNMATVGAIPQNALKVYENVNKMKEDEVIPGRVMEQLAEGKLFGDPKWGALQESIQTYIVNSSAAMTGTQVRVTLAQRMMERAKDTTSPAQLRLIIQQDAADTWSKYQDYIGRWKDLGMKGLPPGAAPDKVKAFSAMLRSNAYTGEMPADAPPNFLAMSRDPSKTKYPSYVQGHTQKPMTEQDLRQNDSIIKNLQTELQNPNLTPEQRQRAEAAIQAHLQALPGVENPPWDYE